VDWWYKFITSGESSKFSTHTLTHIYSSLILKVPQSSSVCVCARIEKGRGREKEKERERKMRFF